MEDQGGKSRGRFDYGWRLLPGERLLKTAEALRILLFGFWVRMFSNGAIIVGSEKIYATGLGFL